MASNNNRIKFGIDFQVNKSGIEDVKKSLQSLKNLKIGDVTGGVDSLRKISEEATKVEQALTKAFNVKLNSVNVDTFNKELQRTGTSVEKVYQAFSKAGTAGKTAFSQMATSVLTTNLQLKQTHSLLQQMGTTMMNTVKWGIASSVMNTFTNSVQQAFQYVTSLDSALTDIRIVTGDSADKMADFAVQANRAAQELGRSTMEYTKSALTFYQQGLNDEQVAARNEAVMKAQNITGAGSEMADYLTAVWNGYKVANQEAELYVDKLAAVADSSASNMSQLAIAMSKVAAAANQLGVPVDSLNAQIATIVATTRDAPESVGNALKTIYSRINDISTGAQDAQISLGNYSSKMAEVGINVLDANGRLRDTGEVIEQIGGKWDTLSKEQQIYLARTMAGQRQYTRLVSLFDNWDKYIQLVNTSLNSQGATMEKNSRYMESLQAHINQLGAAGERVKSAMIDSNSFKGLIDFGTQVTTIFANFIESIGGGGNALLMLGSIFGNVFGNIIARQINGFITNMKAADYNVKQLQADIQLTSQFGKIEGLSENAVKDVVRYKQAIQQYYSTMSTEQINAYNQLVKTVGQLETEYEQKEKIAQLSESIARKEESGRTYNIGDDFTSSFAEYQEYVSKVKTEIEGISVQNEKAEESFRKLLQITNQFKYELGDDFNKFGGEGLQLLQQKFDEARAKGQPLGPIIRQIKEQLLRMANAIQQVNPEKAAQLRAQADALKGRVEQAGNAVEDFIKKAQQMSSVKSFVNIASGIAGIASAINSIINLTKIWNDKNKSVGEKLLQTFMAIGQAAGMLSMNFSKVITSLGQLIAKFAPTIAAEVLHTKAIDDNTGAQIKNIGVQAAGTVGAGAQTTANIGLAASFKLLGGAIQSALLPLLAITAAITATVLIIKAIDEAWNHDARIAEKAAENVEKAKEAYQEAKQAIEDTKSAFDDYQTARDSLEEMVAGTQEWRDAIREVNTTVLELIHNYPELAKAVSNVNGQLVVSQEGMQAYLEKIQQDAQKALINQNNAEQVSREANITSQATNIGREVMDSLGRLATWNYNIDSQEVITAVQVLSSAISEGETNLSRSNKDLLHQIESASGVTEEQAAGLLDNSEKLLQLSKTVEANTAATILQNQNTVQPKLEKNQTYQGLNSSDQAVVTAFSASQYQLDVQQRTEELSQTLSAAFASLNINLSEADIQLIAQNKASAQILEDASIMQTNFQSAIQALNNINTNDNLSSTQQQGIKNLLTNQGFDKDFTESQLKELQDIDWDEVFNQSQLQQMAKALGVDVDTMIANYDRGITDVLSGFDKILQGTSKSVQIAFNKLNTGDMSLSLQQQVIEDLQHAFNEGGIEAMQGVEDFYNQLSDTSKLENALAGIDWETVTPDELQIALQKAGAATDVTTQALQAYINAQKEAADVTSPQEAYKSVNDIISKLKDGDSIDEDQAKVLEKAGMDLTAYFDRYADGSLKLKVKAEEFFEYANNINLNNFKQRINQAQQALNNLQSFESSEYSSSNGGDFNQFSSTAVNTRNIPVSQGGSTSLVSMDQIDEEKLNAQFQFLNGLLTTTNTLTDSEKQLIQEINNESVKLDEKAEDIAKAVAHHKDEWQKGTDRIKEQEQQVSRLSQQLTNSSKIVRQLDPDVDEDKWKNLADYLEKYADVLQDVSDEVKDNRQLAEELAEEMIRYSSALEQVNEKYEEWQKALTSGSLEDQIQAGNELQNVYNDLLGLPFDNLLSSAFTQSTENLQLLQQAANGSQEAYNRLLELAGQDLGAQFGIDPETFQSQLNAVRNLVQNFTHQDWDDIEIGAALNDEGFLQDLTNMVNAAGMGAEEAANYLGSMGIDAEIETVNQPTEEVKQTDGGYITDLIPTDAEETVMVMRGSGTPIPTQVKIPIRRYSAIVRPQPGSTETVKSDNVGTALKVTSATKSSGGGFKFKNSTKPATKTSGGGGGKGGGGGGGTPKAAKTEKHTTAKTKEKIVNPYEAIERSYDRQEKVLKTLNSLESKLTGKDRLVNLQKQVRALQAQNDIIRERAKLSKENVEGTTAWYRNQLAGDEVLKDVLAFDPDKHINVTDLKNAATEAYNDAVTTAADNYNNWLDTVWNTLSGDEQQARKAEKEAWDQQLKDAQTNAQDIYKTRTEWIDAYEKRLEDDIKNHQQYVENLNSILEKQISQITYKVEIAVDKGELKRSLIEFRDVWDQWVDPTAKIRTGLEELKAEIKTNKKIFNSYWDSGEIQKTSDAINDIRTKMESIKKIGATSYSDVYGDLGITREQWKELTDEEKADLRSQAYNALRQQLKEQTENLQDLVKSMAEAVQQSYDNYLDAIDEAKDSMDDLIDQHERVNSLLEHDVALVQMLYGDKAYEAMDKYYNAQYKNDKAQLTQLMSQRAYWEQELKRATDEGLTGTEEWKKIKENLDSVIDATNSKVEEVIELLGKRLENRLNQAVQNVNLKLTGGLGLDYVSDEWDFINDFDDYFLDNVQSKMGIEDVTRAYEQAAADAYGNPKQVQRINKLMNDQLAILKEKDNLTQYDLERAKSMLQVEKARMALEDARENKTKMRLRRDSQGNYTYQYVADEKKLSDLQQALADAQSNLYNQDKEHYKENLNQLHDTYQEYLEGMRELTLQYNATQDEEEKARIAKRIQLYKQNYAKMYDALSEDNKVTHDQYLRQSVIEALGVDATTLTMQQQLDLVNNNVPQAQSAVQSMVDTIIGQGGLLPATSSMLKEFNKATSEYTASIESVLGKVKVNLDDIKSATDVTVQATQQLTSQYKDMEKSAKRMVTYAKNQYQELKNFVHSPEFQELRKYVEDAAKAYNTGNLTAATASNKTGTGSGSSGSTASSSGGKSGGSSTGSSSGSGKTGGGTKSGSSLPDNISINGMTSKGKTAQDLAKDYQNYLAGMKDLTKQYNAASTDKQRQKIQKKVKELEKTVSAESLTAYVDALNSQALSLQDGLKATQAGIKNSVASIINEGTLNQNVTISASFPNVNSSRQIEDAFNNIINQAAQYIGKKKK